MKSKVLRLNSDEIFILKQAMDLLIYQWEKDYNKIKNKSTYDILVKRTYIDHIHDLQKLRLKITNIRVSND